MKTSEKVFLILLIVLLLAALGYVIYQNKNHLLRFSQPTAVQEKPITIAAVGDIACPVGKLKTDSECHQDEVFTQIKQQNPAAILLLGDIQYDKGELTNFNAVFGPVLGDFKNKALPAPGNHEYGTAGAEGYKKFWEGHPKYSEINQTYYKTSLGSWEIFSLNSNCEKIGGCGKGSAEGDWLQAELSKSGRPQCTLAFWHHPIFTSGEYFNNVVEKQRALDLWKILEQSGTDVVLNGHDHVYERFAKQTTSGQKNEKDGIKQFTVGTGGKKLYSFTGKDVNQEFGLDNTFGFLKLELYKHYYKWFFIDEHGQMKDSGTAPCTV
jgi:hypothetical protein